MRTQDWSPCWVQAVMWKVNGAMTESNMQVTGILLFMWNVYQTWGESPQLPVDKVNEDEGQGQGKANQGAHIHQYVIAVKAANSREKIGWGTVRGIAMLTWSMLTWRPLWSPCDSNGNFEFLDPPALPFVEFPRSYQMQHWSESEHILELERYRSRFLGSYSHTLGWQDPRVLQPLQLGKVRATHLAEVWISRRIMPCVVFPFFLMKALDTPRVRPFYQYTGNGSIEIGTAAVSYPSALYRERDDHTRWMGSFLLENLSVYCFIRSVGCHYPPIVS
jgi:hypothetical protein